MELQDFPNKNLLKNIENEIIKQIWHIKPKMIQYLSYNDQYLINKYDGLIA